MIFAHTTLLLSIIGTTKGFGFIYISYKIVIMYIGKGGLVKPGNDSNDGLIMCVLTEENNQVKSSSKQG